ncbi:MAG TPA: DUF892 family protein, partial [Candidatus Paceibacterota bacterium]|nr:DUF892 family protein [Candidatus Paceibacterota bacterium]
MADIKTADEVLETWLNHAHSMEEAIVKVLEAHRKDADGQPEVVAKIEEHLEKTRHHVQLVTARMKELDFEVSRTKKAIAQAAGSMRGFTTGQPSEKLIKNSIDEYSTEYMEIGVYQTIKAVAEGLDDALTVEMCDTIIPEEQEMADWLEENLPDLVQKT